MTGAEGRSGPTGSTQSSRRASILANIAVAGGLATAGIVATYLWSEPEPEGRRLERAPLATERGTACSSLEDAFLAYRKDDQTVLERTVRLAARQAEETLGKSGQTFGKPERIALEIESLVGSSDPKTARLDSLFASAAEACRRLGRWRAEV